MTPPFLFRALLLLCCLASSLPDIAAPQLSAPVRERVETGIKSGAMPSMVIGLIDGDDTAVFAYGLVNGAVPDGDTVYEIGSISKTFTTLLLAKAVENKVVTLDQPLAKLLPAYRIPDFEGKQITLLDLATQSSGLPRLPANLLPKDGDNPYADYHAAELRQFLQAYQLPRQPGAKYEYSNLGVGLLGFALSEQEKTPYAELVQQQIAGPLGMRSTGVDLTPAMRAHLAPGHTAAGKPIVNWDFDVLAGAGGIRSDVNDMMRYLQAFMHAKTGGTGPFALATAPQRGTDAPGMRIGLAWMTTEVRGQSIVWHNGMTGGYASFAGFTADGKHGVVVLTNSAISVDDVAFQVLSPKTTAAEQEITLEPAVLAEYEGDYALSPDFILHVRRTPTGLSVQATGQQAFPVFARARDEFFFRVVDAQLSFQRDAAGKVASVVLHQGGRDMPGKKAAAMSTDKPAATAEKPAPQEITLEPAVLNDYPGRYEAAAGFIVQITRSANGLQAQLTGQAAYPIFASARDEFFWKVVHAQASFQRDAAGKITGLVLHQGGHDIAAKKLAD